MRQHRRVAHLFRLSTGRNAHRAKHIEAGWPGRRRQVQCGSQIEVEPQRLIDCGELSGGDTAHPMSQPFGGH
jgi:hypothetical protein